MSPQMVPNGEPRARVVVEDARCPDDSSDVDVDVERWSALASAVLATEAAEGELTLTFVDEADIAELNQVHMGQSGPTDVLSFPMDDHGLPGVPTMLGDIVISPRVAQRQYADHAGTLDDEIALLVVHGILHVMGHDHHQPDAAAVMQRRELDMLTAHHWRGPPPSGFRQLHN